MRFRFTGQTLIAPLNLYYYKARFYSPTLGRFLQTDPIGQQDDMNLYAYVCNNPINRVDPSGFSKMRLSDLQLSNVTGQGAITYNGQRVGSTTGFISSINFNVNSDTRTVETSYDVSVKSNIPLLDRVVGATVNTNNNGDLIIQPNVIGISIGKPVNVTQGIANGAVEGVKKTPGGKVVPGWFNKSGNIAKELDLY